MSERISLANVIVWAEGGDIPARAAEEVMALVEAVEAAHAYLAVPRKAVRDEATGVITADFRPQQKAQRVLADALARFEIEAPK